MNALRKALTIAKLVTRPYAAALAAGALAATLALAACAPSAAPAATSAPTSVVTLAAAPATNPVSAATPASPAEPSQTTGGITTPVQLDLGGAFSMPIVSPEVSAPPYRYKDTKETSIVFITDPQVLGKLVPAPLKPSPDQPLVLYIGYFQFADYDLPYHEAGLLVPVIRDGKPAGYFAVVLYLDQPSPIVGGREVYGWPKKEADRIVYEEENGKITAGVTRYGKEIIKVSFEAQQKVEPVPPRAKDTYFLLKLIPSVKKDAPPDVLKLISTVMDSDVIKELRVGKGTLEFGDSPSDPFLAKIPVKQVVYSETIVHDFTLGYGDVVVDYLASGSK